MRRLLFLLPMTLLLLLGLFLLVGLGLNPRLIPSPLVDRPAPAFTLPALEDPERRVGHTDLQGRVALVNVWASWCTSCRREHRVLSDLARRHDLPLYGINYKDERADALAYLGRFGNPYRWNGHDREGRAGIDWGVYGTPETFVLDADGRIRYKHAGPLTPERVQREILPLVARLRQEDP
ncbi:DsbE family thiol:disulfide interchange protein [Ectothiorhodospira mobilis]|uniref:DsbE family thiol:disulfide interchange protein n=1 Tax=Ectothiorhodospira mobilis TaxID=195064 RepID=UPI0019057E01|nr:DsbE family thiol:disulfide interchange protein [Ectothiorhodospira mobilis]MBK1692780.1 DsbE family thiol:disulfide interchange protein [Ectothiorhodospira mobilis]